MTKRHRATRAFSDFEIRADDDGGLHFRGHAAVFDSPSVEFWPGYWEEVGRNAFDETLANDPRVLMLHNHDVNLVLSSTDNDTLRLEVDDVGLAVDADFAPVSWAPDVATLYKDGYLKHMSFGFWIIEMHDEERPNGIAGVLDQVDLDGGDVSTVSYPAYLETDGEMRARAVAGALRTVSGVDVHRAADVYRTLREGRVLSKSNRKLIEEAVDALRAVLAADDKEDVNDDEERSGDTARMLRDRDRHLQLLRGML